MAKEEEHLSNRCNKRIPISMIYIFLSAIWFIVSAILIVYTVDIEDITGWLRGLESFMTALFFIVVGIPILIFYIFNLYKSLEKYNLDLNDKDLLFISSLLMMIYYCIFSYFVISRLYYIYFYGIAMLIVLHYFFFFILFSHTFSVIFNLKYIWRKMQIYVFIIFIVLFGIIVNYDYMPISHSKEIYQTEWKIRQERIEREFQDSIYTYTYTENNEEDWGKTEETIQFLSHAKSSDEFATGQYSNSILYITKKSIFTTDDTEFIGNYINEIYDSNLWKNNYFASNTAYGIDVERSDDRVLSITEYWNTWIFGLDIKNTQPTYFLDERFTTINDILNINKHDMIEKQEQGDHIEFNGEKVSVY